MQISNHYLPYAKKTLIVLTNNELAKILHAHEKEVEEIDSFEIESEMPENERGSSTPNAGPPRFEEIKKQIRQELYTELNDRLLALLKDGAEQIILCAPEVHKNEIFEAMHTDVQSNVSELVAKNLAMLPLDAIIRILNENKPAA